ncbi:RAS-related protein rab11b [Phtheirospermum japonicum]|uniref:RAS-related protein rab11b n=1 Tax=Phtheirospermum japonicum TaxID=374723 RepID=A0A830D7M9_9LAMI|nr:RAS-related protein rab11b [Phtheirospermum japonicum]
MIRSSRLRFGIPPGKKGTEQSQVPTTRGYRSIVRLRCHMARYIRERREMVERASRPHGPEYCDHACRQQGRFMPPSCRLD